MKSIDFRIFRTNWISEFLPIELWLETSATALCGPYVTHVFSFGNCEFQEVRPGHREMGRETWSDGIFDRIESEPHEFPIKSSFQPSLSPIPAEFWQVLTKWETLRMSFLACGFSRMDLNKSLEIEHGRNNFVFYETKRYGSKWNAMHPRWNAFDFHFIVTALRCPALAKREVQPYFSNLDEERFSRFGSQSEIEELKICITAVF